MVMSVMSLFFLKMDRHASQVAFYLCLGCLFPISGLCFKPSLCELFKISLLIYFALAFGINIIFCLLFLLKSLLACHWLNKLEKVSKI